MRRAGLGWAPLLVLGAIGCAGRVVGTEGTAVSGAENGPCLADGSCNPGLLCNANVCVVPSGAFRAVGSGGAGSYIEGGVQYFPPAGGAGGAGCASIDASAGSGGGSGRAARTDHPDAGARRASSSAA